MNALASIIPAPLELTAYELAELAREDAHEQWREQMAELAWHNRAYRDGDWDLDDWIEWSGEGRGEEHAALKAAIAKATGGVL